MWESVSEFFSTHMFMPHGHCYMWRPGLLWTQVLSNGFIAASYIFIAVTLAYLVKKGQYLPFKGMALAFGVFIISCGITHIMDVYVIWEPAYWLDGAVRIVTAVASVGTAIMLPFLVPKAVALARGAKAAHERGVHLEAVVDDLGRLVERTQELDRVKTEFFANVSHELRTPLALILGPAARLREGETDPDRLRDLEVIERNARAVLVHVNDLLEVARLEADRSKVEYARVDMASLVRRVAGQFDSLARERSTALVIDTPEVLDAELDQDKVSRVLVNLVGNAFKFTPQDGKVRVSLRQQRKRLEIEVADSGPGVRPEDRSLIFERFRQAEGGTTRRHGGTGLGLTIARDIVRLHGGDISVDEAAEGGALFRVELPVRAPEGSEVAEVSEEMTETAEAALSRRPAVWFGPNEGQLAGVDPLTERVAAASEAAQERPLILVAEDHPDMNRFVTEVLAADYRVEGASDGRAALERAVASRPDLIVSDVMMPEMSGEELLAAVRANPETAGIPVLLLTARADEDLRLRALSEGAQDFLTKPFTPAELVARARNLVTMKRARDVLQAALRSQVEDVERLATDLSGRSRELELTADALRVAREQAERASQLKTDFLSLVSHELRSPVTALMLQLERLRAEGAALPAPSEEVLDRMARTARRLENLVDGLLEHARIQAGRLEIHPEPVDVAAMTDEVIEQLRPEAERKGLELSVQRRGELGELVIDPRILRLILGNLTGNAVRHTESGEVTITLERQGNHHVIAVADTGPGIRPEQRATIFEAFVQGEDTRAKHAAGVGLGLALVRDLVRAVGAELVLESELGRGSTFTVRLPARR